MRYIRPARFSTMHEVDTFLLELELTARQIRCEVPLCTAQAVGVYGDEMPAFLCQEHTDMCEQGMRNKVKATITQHMQRVVIEAANRAWAGTDDAVVFTYDPGNEVRRYVETPLVIPKITLTTVPAKVRPPMASLPIANSEMTAVEFFPPLF
jgi:hypothetical protein